MYAKQIARYWIYTAAIFSSSVLAADEEMTIKARVSAFFPSTSLYRKIYGSCNGSYQLEVSKAFCPFLEGWGNLEWVSKEGRSYRLNDSTTLSMLNLSLGVKYPYCINESLTAYGGIGPLVGVVFVHNHYRSSIPSSQEEGSHFRKKESKAAFGAIAKFGVYYWINCHFFVDLFIDYSYQSVRFNSRLNVGGVKTGGGVGYSF